MPNDFIFTVQFLKSKTERNSYIVNERVIICCHTQTLPCLCIYIYSSMQWGVAVMVIALIINYAFRIGWRKAKT